MAETDASPALHALTCPYCGTHFAVEESLWARKRGDQTVFSCPNSHSLFFPDRTAETPQVKPFRYRQGREPED